MIIKIIKHSKRLPSISLVEHPEPSLIIIGIDYFTPLGSTRSKGFLLVSLVTWSRLQSCRAPNFEDLPYIYSSLPMSICFVPVSTKFIALLTTYYRFLTTYFLSVGVFSFYICLRYMVDSIVLCSLLSFSFFRIRFMSGTNLFSSSLR